MAVKSAGRSSFSRGKRVLIALNVLLMTVLAFALFAGVCHLASLPAFRTRIDLTRERAFTLSPLTLELLQSMDKEVQVYSFYQRPYGFDPTGRSQVEMEVIAYANRLLEEYVIHSRGMIQVELLDRDRDNLRVEEVHGRIGLGESNSVIFLCDSNRKDLPASDLARIDAGGVDPATNVIQPARILAYNAESALTSALLSVIEERKPKVYFTTGRREASIEDLGPDGIAGAAEILRRANFDVGALKVDWALRVDTLTAVMLVVVADEGDVIILVLQLGVQHRAVPVDQRRAVRGAQHEMGKHRWRDRLGIEHAAALVGVGIHGRILLRSTRDARPPRMRRQEGGGGLCLGDL